MGVAAAVTTAAVLAVPAATASAGNSIKIVLPAHFSDGAVGTITLTGHEARSGGEEVTLYSGSRKCAATFAANTDPNEWVPGIEVHGHYTYAKHDAYANKTPGWQYFCAYLVDVEESGTIVTTAHAGVRVRYQSS